MEGEHAEGGVPDHGPEYARQRLGAGWAAWVWWPDRPARRSKRGDQACELLGWEYRLVGAAEVILVRNVRWLAGYRHPRFSTPGSSEPSLEAHLAAFAEPAPLTATAESIGDPIAVLPVLFHLLWRQELVTDLTYGSSLIYGRDDHCVRIRRPCQGSHAVGHLRLESKQERNVKLFTAYSSAELEAVRATRQLVLRPVPGTAPPLGLVELLLTEDMRYWREVIEAQPDRERIYDYDYAVVVAVEVPTEFVADLVTSSEYGRISAAVADMFAQLDRPGPAPIAHPLESEVFILNRIDESVDVADGMTQHYVLRGGLTDTGSLLDAFSQRVQRIDVVGGVAGARESI